MPGVFTGDELKWIEDAEAESDGRFFHMDEEEAALKRFGRSHIRSVDVLSDDLSGLLFTVRIKDYLISVCSSETFDFSCLISLSEDDIVSMRSNA